MIRVHRLSKRYGELLALDNVSFVAKPGEVLGLLGPNGAGKSTLMKILSGFLCPTNGSATVHDEAPAYLSPIARSRIGYLPERAALYSEMRISEYLHYRAELNSVPSAKRAKRIDAAVELCGLGPVLRRIIAQLSKGYRQRVALAAVLLHNPSVLVLDEPTSGLDPLQMVEIRTLVRTLAERCTVLFSTHLLAEAEAVCQRVLMLRRGRIIADGNPDAIRRSTFGDVIRIELAPLGQESPLEHVLEKLRLRFPDAVITPHTRTDTPSAALSKHAELVSDLQQDEAASNAGEPSAPLLRFDFAMPGAHHVALRSALARSLHELGTLSIEMSSALPSLESLFNRLMDPAEPHE